MKKGRIVTEYLCDILEAAEAMEEFLSTMSSLMVA